MSEGLDPVELVLQLFARGRLPHSRPDFLESVMRTEVGRSKLDSMASFCAQRWEQWCPSCASQKAGPGAL